METTRIKLNDNSIIFAEDVDIIDGVMNIRLGERYTCEQAQELFSDEVKLSHIQLMTMDDDDVYGVYGGYSELQGVTLFGSCKCVKLCKQGDDMMTRIVSAEAAVSRMQTALDEIESGDMHLKNEFISASVKVSRIAAQTLSDEDAKSVKILYPSWNELVASNTTAESAGYKFVHENLLYKTKVPNVTFQSNWIPGQGTESLFTVIDESHSGSVDDPIPAELGMEYVKGKVYVEEEVKYLMSRPGMNDGDTVVLNYLPSQLEGNYFTKILSSIY